MRKKTNYKQIGYVRGLVLEAYTLNKDQLALLAFSLTPNRAVAQDMLQETFLRFLQTLLRGEEIADHAEWLRSSMRDLIRDWRASSDLRYALALEDVAGIEARPTRSNEVDTVSSTMVKRAVRLLAPREKECFSLRSRGLAYNEIAIKMHIEATTVGALLNRAVDKIRKAVPHTNRA